MGMGFATTWLRQVSPLLHMTTLTTAYTVPTLPAGVKLAQLQITRKIIQRALNSICSWADLTPPGNDFDVLCPTRGLCFVHFRALPGGSRVATAISFNAG